MPQENIAEPFPVGQNYFSVSYASPGIQRRRCASFYAQALLSFIRGYKHYSFHSESFTAKNHVSARHSIQMLHQHPGACLSAFLAIPLRACAISTDLRSIPVILTPMGMRRSPTPRSSFGCLGTALSAPMCPPAGMRGLSNALRFSNASSFAPHNLLSKAAIQRSGKASRIPERNRKLGTAFRSPTATRFLKNPTAVGSMLPPYSFIPPSCFS
jgi:hypothetical protein